MDSSPLLTQLQIATTQGSTQALGMWLQAHSWEQVGTSEDDDTTEEHWHLAHGHEEPLLRPQLWLKESKAVGVGVGLIIGVPSNPEAEELAASIGAFFDQSDILNIVEQDAIWTSWGDGAIRVDVGIHPESTAGRPTPASVHVNIEPASAVIVNDLAVSRVKRSE